MTATETPAAATAATAGAAAGQAAVRVRAADLGAVVRDPAALEAARTLVRVAREEARNGAPPDRRFATALLGGRAVGRTAIEERVGERRVRALVDVGACTATADEMALGFSVLFYRQIAVAYPHHQTTDFDCVYLGVEAPWLIQVAWHHGPGRGSMADLATGTGVIAAVLSARYETVVACDLAPRSVDCAALTLALNRVHGRRTLACRADVASGLPRGSFDLVVGNPPWVPAAAEAATRFRYAVGGATGMELPARFLDEGAALLAPGGVSIVSALDTLWDDGRRPLQDQIGLLRRRGFGVRTVSAHPSAWAPGDTDDLIREVPGCVGGELVAVVVTRPD